MEMSSSKSLPSPTSARQKALAKARGYSYKRQESQKKSLLPRKVLRTDILSALHQHDKSGGGDSHVYGAKIKRTTPHQCELILLEDAITKDSRINMLVRFPTGSLPNTKVQVELKVLEVDREEEKKEIVNKILYDFHVGKSYGHQSSEGCNICHLSFYVPPNVIQILCWSDFRQLYSIDNIETVSTVEKMKLRQQKDKQNDLTLSPDAIKKLLKSTDKIGVLSPSTKLMVLKVGEVHVFAARCDLRELDEAQTSLHVQLQLVKESVVKRKKVKEIIDTVMLPKVSRRGEDSSMTHVFAKKLVLKKAGTLILQQCLTSLKTGLVRTISLHRWDIRHEGTMDLEKEFEEEEAKYKSLYQQHLQRVRQRYIDPLTGEIPIEKVEEYRAQRNILKKKFAREQTERRSILMIDTRKERIRREKERIVDILSDD
eukprot:g3730.t1